MDVADIIGQEDREEANATVAIEREVAGVWIERLERLLHQYRRLLGIDLKEGAGRNAKDAIQHVLVNEVLADDDTTASAGQPEDHDAHQVGYRAHQRLTQRKGAALGIDHAAGPRL